MAHGDEKPIEAIRPGDFVTSFDALADGGRGALVPGQVTRLFRNVTETVLSVNGVLTTPGHHWLTADGRMDAMERILARGAQVVDAAGRASPIAVERFDFGAAMADRFEVATDWITPEAGALALKPEVRTGWRTYNFEVEHLHTYVAGGFRVHNLSAPSFVELDGNGQRMPHVVTELGVAPNGDTIATGVAYVNHRGDTHLLETAPGADGNSTVLRETIYEAESGHVRDWVNVSVVNNASGAVDTTHRYNGADQLIELEDWNADGSHADTFYDAAFGDRGTVWHDPDGDVSQARLGSTTVGASQVGELFGSLLGKSIGNGNQLVEIGAGTLLGLTLSRLGSALEAGFQGDEAALVAGLTRQSEADLGAALGGFGADVLDRLGGVGSSLLVAELADALGISGFEGQMFTAAVNGVTSQLVKNAMTEAARGAAFDIGNVFALNPATLATSVANSFGGLFGAALGSKIITPETPAAAVFASASSAVGALAGTAVATAMFSAIPFIGPFVGSLLGQVLGTWAANALVDNDDLAGVRIGVDPATGLLGHMSTRIVDQGNLAIAGSIATSVTDTVNGFLGGHSFTVADNGFSVEVGYYNTSQERLYAFAGTHQEFYRNRHGDTDEQALARTAQSAIDQALAGIQLAGGDPLHMRAFNTSRAQSPGDDGLLRLSFDLQVAKDYDFYLAHQGPINSLIAAEPTSAFAAGWAVTLLRAGELGLNQPVVLPASVGSDGATRTITYVNREMVSAVVVGTAAADVLAGTRGQDTLHGGAGDDTLDGGAGADRLDGGAGLDTVSYAGFGSPVSVNLVSNVGWDGRVNDLLSGIERVVGSSYNDHLVGGAGAETLQGGAGDDTLDGGAGADWLVGGDGLDTVDYAGFGAAVSVNLAAQLSWDGQVNDSLVGIEQVIGSSFGDHLVGAVGAETLLGGAADDILAGGAGADWLAGGAGFDLADYVSPAASHRVLAYGTAAVVAGAGSGVDRLTDIERLRFSDGLRTPFDNALDYIASHADLRANIGPNGQAALDHFAAAGYAEGRSITFSGLSYIAANPDLISAYGTNGSAGAQHHILHGASQPWRPLSFDALRYVASNPDLIAAFGADERAGVTHWIEHGFAAGRQQTAFDAAEYLTHNADLRTAYGGDLRAATTHFIEHGLAEGRVWRSNTSDFDGSGTSDLLWRRSDGYFATWSMFGGGAAPNVYVNATVGPNWRIESTGDFNGDGKADLLWREIGGTLTMWQMHGSSAEQNVFWDNSVPSSWSIRATGDYNGDGRDDILWRHTDGALSVWNMHGATAVANVYQTAGVPNTWHIVGSGDFNGDGSDDLLWRHDSGQVASWEFRNNVPTANVLYGWIPTDWHVRGTGDFNGDGADDILWRRDDGYLAVWTVRGGTVTPGFEDGTLHPNWQVGPIGDYNADGIDDIAFRHVSGPLRIWEMHGSTASRNTFADDNVGTNWTLFQHPYEVV